ncbi:bifunctional histidinol-phosphatase/imidazoleglycerol-phosphate dehydratase HisB [Flavisolibacter ginsenosidimutans]|uniref:Histidine biosynthesis bifunctional protein HisB n=1 Tax=Flavisolibacter ginsenosidimutans TaxID=661481 RepID=A0A5B8UIE6_9BACT|nr:bifunctional histidinol-phosphatase/imidazoleglycerol-phosphate dehydratase HisB [Flavisolibacter ginsenosidimutans]QEC55949.1 bifunctional histidinol-phosphatase/imidazoleglycerol-phosphate dehydratase HisB [Flavisolibacter ginsenosidimutans]
MEQKKGKRVLFVDRDGTMIKEYPPLYQIDSLEKVTFYPFAIKYLSKIAEEMDYELVMVSNQDGLGTPKFPESDFWPAHNLVIQTFEGEGVFFKEQLIDRSFPEDNLPTRKPGTGMFGTYLNNPEYDIPNSYVIGDRITDVQLAKNLGCKALWLNNNPKLGGAEVKDSIEELRKIVAVETMHWKDFYDYLKKGPRVVKHVRKTAETEINIELNLDGSGKAAINTGLEFFNHMLDQIARHGLIDLTVDVKGDLEIDEHHTVEDTGLALGEAIVKALGDKRGIERYGFALPMDEVEAKVLIDFGGRPWIIWNADFHRERVGDVPTEMFFHFFKSFSDTAKCNLNIECKGENEHHKIEAVFKAFAKAIKMAVKKDPLKNYLPSTKGSL